MILIVIVPKIAPLFADLKSLPMTTHMLMAASDHILKWWWIDMLVAGTAIVLHLRYHNKGRYMQLLKSMQVFFAFYGPYIKDIYVLWYIEKWMQVVCICLQSNLSLHTSLQLSRESLSCRFML